MIEQFYSTIFLSNRCPFTMQSHIGELHSNNFKIFSFTLLLIFKLKPLASFVLVGETNKTANIGFLYPSNKSSLENLYRIGNRIKSVNVSPKKEKS